LQVTKGETPPADTPGAGQGDRPTSGIDCYPLSPMADYHEILHERLYVKVPGSDKLRKTATNRLKHLESSGWRELERDKRADHIMVKFERTGHAPMKARLPKQGPEIRIERRPRRDDNRRGGGRR
jgi:hypothetical protein